MNNWLSLTKEEQIRLFNQAGNLTGLPPYTIEKDAWVTLILRMLFTSELYAHIVFKGGTSLSKAYNLIERFSEDIDLSISREYLGHGGEVTKRLIKKLRRSSNSFSAEILPQIITRQLTSYGLAQEMYKFEIENPERSTEDPKKIYFIYNSVFDTTDYLKSGVLIEFGARFLQEPNEEKYISSIIDENYTENQFAEKPFKIKTVIPEKTLLEKMILLHEKFESKSASKADERISRHLYDIYKISKSVFLKTAMSNNSLFNSIVEHRKLFSPINQINYDELLLKELKFIPEDENAEHLKKDYKKMQENMIYGDSPSFDKLLSYLRETFQKSG